MAKKVENNTRQNGQYCEPGVSGRDTEVIIHENPRSSFSQNGIYVEPNW